MFKLLGILWNSFRMAVQELRVNKLRTFLSLFGITIGIFCIIGVLATVNSLERKVQQDIKKLGSNSIYIDKWQYGGGEGGKDYPWWKFIKRPSPKYEELQFIKAKSELAGNIAFTCSTNGSVSYENSEIAGTNLIGASEDFDKIQSLIVQNGRYISDVEFSRGTPTVVIGNNLATELFGKPREKNSEINEVHRNIAASVQVCYENILFDILNYIYKKFRIDRLTLSGGCAQNSLANGKIINNTSFKSLFIPANPGDAGGAVGSAYSAWHQITKSRPSKNKTAYLGGSIQIIILKKLY